MFDLDAYLTRIALPRPAADADGLARLQRAHRLAIPFDALDVALGRPVAIDGAAVFAKLVRARRGGYCFEHNRLLLDALAALGFAARPLLARVWIGATETPPLTHTLSLVTVAGRDFIADAGFGGGYAPVMPLVDGAEAVAPDGARFLLCRAGDGWMLHRDGSPGGTDGRETRAGLRPQFSFTTATVHPADLALSNHWTATARDSRFVRHRVASIVLDRGFASLVDRRHSRTDGDAALAEDVADPETYRRLLGDGFGIDLAADEATALWRAAPPSSQVPG